MKVFYKILCVGIAGNFCLMSIQDEKILVKRQQVGSTNNFPSAVDSVDTPMIFAKAFKAILDDPAFIDDTSAYIVKYLSIFLKDVKHRLGTDEFEDLVKKLSEFNIEKNIEKRKEYKEKEQALEKEYAAIKHQLTALDDSAERQTSIERWAEIKQELKKLSEDPAYKEIKEIEKAGQQISSLIINAGAAFDSEIGSHTQALEYIEAIGQKICSTVHEKLKEEKSEAKEMKKEIKNT